MLLRLGLAAGLMLALSGGAVAEPVSCSVFATKFNGLLKTGSKEDLFAVYDALAPSKLACKSKDRSCIKRALSRRLWRIAEREYVSGRKRVAMETLEHVVARGDIHQARLMLGQLVEQLESGHERYLKAAKHFQHALVDAQQIDSEIRAYEAEREKNPDAKLEVCPGDMNTLPDMSRLTEMIERMMAAKRYALSKQLRLGDPPLLKNGDYGGSYALGYKGIGFRSVPTAIQFETDKATLSVLGRKEADDVAKYLRETNLYGTKEKKIESIVLTGHTDTRGSRKYNCSLARRRLETVKAYLQSPERGENQFKGKIALENHGEDTPAKIYDRGTRSDDYIWTANRRVNLVVNGDGGGGKCGG